MNRKLNFLLFFTICILILTSVSTKAQTIEREVVASSGDYHVNSIAQVEWSLGEISTEYYSSSSLSLGQGFHQIYIETIGISENQREFKAKVYPNPTKNGVFVEGQDVYSLNFASIQDIHGKHIRDYVFNSHIEKQFIDIEFLPPGIYILNLQDVNKGIVKSFKIIKE